MTTRENREKFREALDKLGHPEATVYGHWALKAYDEVYHPELREGNLVYNFTSKLQRNGYRQDDIEAIGKLLKECLT